MGPFGNINQMPSPFLLFVLYMWSLFWKGIALWRAGKIGQRNWFVALLVLNTAGILEIVYLFKFCKKPLTISEMKSWFVKEK